MRRWLRRGEERNQALEEESTAVNGRNEGSDAPCLKLRSAFLAGGVCR